MLLTVEQFLTLWKIPEDYPLISAHEFIMLFWEDLNHDRPNKNLATLASWDIQNFTKSLENLELDSADLISQSKDQKLLNHIANQKHLDEEIN